MNTRKEIEPIVTIPFVDRAFEIWEEWDLTGKLCPHSKDGWVAWHKSLMSEKSILKETA